MIGWSGQEVRKRNNISGAQNAFDLGAECTFINMKRSFPRNRSTIWHHIVVTEDETVFQMQARWHGGIGQLGEDANQ